MKDLQNTTPLRRASELRQREAMVRRVQERAREMAAAAFGRFVRFPESKEWIQFQFYHWVLDDQRREFQRQLSFLREHGDFISMDDAVVALSGQSGIGGRYFCLTFDDGFRNCLVNAAPILKEMGVPAAFFVPTKYIGLDLQGDWRLIAPFYQESWSECGGVFEFLRWEDCAELAAAGFAVGSHTHTHRRLSSLSPDEAGMEMALSKEIIQQRLSRPCRHFCCPWGKAHRDFDPAVHPQMARKLGYESFLTAENGVSFHGDCAFYIRRNGCEPDFGPSALRYSLFARSPALNGRTRVKRPITNRMIEIREPEPVQVGKFPFPFESAFAVASDIDSASVRNFQAIHALFCGSEILRPGTPDWQTLGLTTQFDSYDESLCGVRGLGLDFADSFFLVGDKTTFGIYRHVPGENRFRPDFDPTGQDCGNLIRQWIKSGRMDSFHAFLHFTREQLTPLLDEFYGWCERDAVAKPRVWINHSLAVTPTGLCPRRMQPNGFARLVRVSARNAIGPMVGFKRVPLRSAFARYCGGSPESPHYINDVLANHGLRYVWLNMDDLHCNRIALPECRLNDRDSILHPVLMDDGTRYYRFERCYGKPSGQLGGECYLRDSENGFDASCLITERNLQHLCRSEGSCILYVHWTHPRSLPISNETLLRFALLKDWRDAGRVWITSTGKLLEWTRRRTFLDVACHREGRRLIVDLKGVNDPIFGSEPFSLAEMDRLSLNISGADPQITIAVNGSVLAPHQVHRAGSVCWLDGAGCPASVISPQPLAV